MQGWEIFSISFYYKYLLRFIVFRSKRLRDHYQSFRHGFLEFTSRRRIYNEVIFPFSLPHELYTIYFLYQTTKPLIQEKRNKTSDDYEAYIKANKINKTKQN